MCYKYIGIRKAAHTQTQTHTNTHIHKHTKTQKHKHYIQAAHKAQTNRTAAEDGADGARNRNDVRDSLAFQMVVFYLFFLIFYCRRRAE